MSLERLSRRLDRVEQAQAKAEPLGRRPALRIITRSDEDRDRQLAALTASGEYEPDRFLIEWRIVEPDPALRNLWRLHS